MGNVLTYNAEILKDSEKRHFSAVSRHFLNLMINISTNIQNKAYTAFKRACFYNMSFFVDKL